jgi:hypothetical protein
LQGTLTQEIINTRLVVNHLGQVLDWQNVQIANLQVRFMNSADVTVVVTVLEYFQIQILLNLLGCMGYGKQMNFNQDV